MLQRLYNEQPAKAVMSRMKFTKLDMLQRLYLRCTTCKGGEVMDVMLQRLYTVQNAKAVKSWP